MGGVHRQHCVKGNLTTEEVNGSLKGPLNMHDFDLT